MRILVVEDMIVQSRAIARILSPYGSCDCVSDGMEAVEAFQQALLDKKPYQLICMDINMPRMDGQEALRQIRGIEKKCGMTPGKRTRILMTTAQNDPSNVVAALQGECDGYLLKPLNQDLLSQKLQEFGFAKKTPDEKKPGPAKK
ncbi:MAG TPA: response regulator [Verrucomicrobia bacterium]|nr:response regulator [Verrucomicrobiota bacterium]